MIGLGVVACSDDDGGSGAVRGSVTGRACTTETDCTDQAVTGAQIELRPAGSPDAEPRRTISDSSGEFRIEVEPGDWVLTVPAIPGLAASTALPVTVSAGSTTDVPVEMRAENPAEPPAEPPAETPAEIPAG